MFWTRLVLFFYEVVLDLWKDLCSFSFSFHSVCRAAKIEAKQAIAVPRWPLWVKARRELLLLQALSTILVCGCPVSAAGSAGLAQAAVLPMEQSASSITRTCSRTHQRFTKWVNWKHKMIWDCLLHPTFTTQISWVVKTRSRNQGRDIPPEIALWLKQWPRTEESNTIPICFKICLQAVPDLLT